MNKAPRAANPQRLKVNGQWLKTSNKDSIESLIRHYGIFPFANKGKGGEQQQWPARLRFSRENVI